MFDKSHEYYDLIYRSFKNYRKESKKISALLQQRCPDCHTVLDIACGTGEHHLYLKDKYKIEGLDINLDFTKIAHDKNPEIIYHHKDMTDFSLENKFDAVLCLFSSIGYLLSIDQVIQTFVNFRRHLNPAGIVIVEPWFSPEVWHAGRTSMVTAENENTQICRMSVTGKQGNLSSFHCHYLLGHNQKIEHFEEEHRLTLYTREEMTKAFETAKLNVEYESYGLCGRGLYIGRIK